LIVFAQEGTNSALTNQKAQQVLEKLTPEQKIGQLFLVTFQGNEVNTESQIYDLIVNHFIGGVILKRENDNFTGPEKTIEDSFNLISNLQNVAADYINPKVDVTQQSPVSPTESVNNETFVPLFVGISQDGDLYPFDQILNGLTPLPNQMAIGATWDPTYSEKVGTVMGSELHNLGFNLFLGPSLDVLDINYTGSGDDLGTRTFGGDPFWVSQMGRAYIRGLHKGSNQQIAVIAKHFPGRGGSDRLPEAEVATVRKSLEQLRLIELAPFFAVTGNAKEENEIAEGLLLSHIRYQGLQGNIRAFTKPISLDPAALGVLMKLPEFSDWRNNGGIIVSDDLGSQAIRRSYDPSGKTFDARQVVLSAFLAGNDLLYMDRIIATGDQDTYSTILRILEFFTQKYREDRSFADRVDASVGRLLELKFRIYGTFDLKKVLPDEKNISEIGNAGKVSFEVASKGIALISPESNDLPNTIARPPDLSSNMVFITDTISCSQCSSCMKQTELSVDEFEKAVMKLYGPNAGGQISQNHLSSFTFEDLDSYLDSPFNHLDLETSLNKADWLIFSLLSSDPNRPASNVLHRLISERPQIIRDKKIIAFAFNIPYRLDATDVSNLTAYYGVFSKIPSFVEVAARVVFQEINPEGASPVSVPGVAYDLNIITSPDPQQIIPLVIDLEGDNLNLATIEPNQSSIIPAFFIGDLIPLRSGVILDHNKHPVPDNTVVKFVFTLSGEKSITQQIESITQNGIARTTFRIQDPGILEIKVNSDPAGNSDILLLEISPGKSIIVSAITPTAIPIIPTEQEAIASNQQSTLIINLSKIDARLEWLIVIVILWSIAGLMIWVGYRYFSILWGLRAGLLEIICGLATYLWITLGLPGSAYHHQSGGFGRTIILVLLFAGFGLVINWIWNRRYPMK
jgi:beta-N-acetylhexosaminidase